jgi:two-component system, cell cycle sensor histidine kinase and response regulator CckA
MKLKQNLALIITWLSGIIITILVIIFPLVYFFISYQHMIGGLETEGRIGAGMINKIISTNPEAWEFEQERLQIAISNYPRKGYSEIWRTLNIKDEVIAESTTQLEEPYVKRSFELMDSGVVVGKLEIYRSVRPLLIKTGLIVLVMLPLGAGAFLILYTLPIRTLYQAEEALRKSKQLLEKTFASLYDAIFIIDAQTGKIIDCNPTAIKMFGYNKEEILGRTTRFLHISEKEKETFDASLDSAIKEKGFLYLREFSMKHKDGTAFPAEQTVLPLEDEHKNHIGWVKVVRDISEQKKMEEELIRAQKLESLGILAGGIAHDFNNLLTSIMGNISLIKLYIDSPDELSQILEDAEKASLRARDLTHQLLTFSKGGAPIKKATSIVELAKDSARFALRGSNVRCDFSFPEDLWTVNVDIGQISQVINNMIINADQAMPEGGIINVRFGNVTLAENDIPLLNTGEYVKISIKDQGIGISGEYLQKIFDPYFTTKQKGSGLGLATAYSIIKKHNGQITVDSKMGSGTTFHIYLPASKEKVLLHSADHKTKLKGSGKILFMDDEEAVRKTTGFMLGSLGYNVEFARDGDEATELYKKAIESGEPFDAVIMDLTIAGGMGGKEAVKKLIELNPDVKTIVSSGYSNDPVMSAYKQYGFHGVITKPYQIEELSDTISKVIATGT